MHLVRRLADQEQASGDQDQVPAGDLVSKHGEERGGQPHQPGEREQQADADHQRQRDADPADALALVRGDAPDQDRDEDHVVDPQHDLHRCEREQGNPGIGIGGGVHGAV